MAQRQRQLAKALTPTLCERTGGDPDSPFGLFVLGSVPSLIRRGCNQTTLRNADEEILSEIEIF